MEKDGMEYYISNIIMVFEGEYLMEKEKNMILMVNQNLKENT